MAKPLFRQQVLTRQQERHWGHCVGLKPVMLSLLTWGLLVLVMVIVGFLVTGNYQRKARVGGVLVSDKGTIQVRAPAAGIIGEVVAGSGKRVGYGDLLLSVQSGPSELKGRPVVARLLEENRHQVALLEDRISENQAENRLRQARASVKVRQLEKRMKQQDAVIANEDALVSLRQQHANRLQALGTRQWVAESAVAQARMELLRQENTVMQSRLERDRLEQLLDEAVENRTLLAHGFARKHSELKQSLSELKVRGLQLLAEAMLDVVSPVTGTVAVTLVEPGQQVQSGQSLMTLLVEGAMLQATLQVPSRAAGFLSRGQAVNLRLDAFPYQKFGLQSATISDISGTVIVPSLQGEQGEPYYRATAILDHQSVRAFGQDLALRPGMKLEADIVLEERSLLAWLLEPLLISGRQPGWL